MLKYLHDIDSKAKEQYDLLIKQLVERRGFTEELKSENQMLWEQKMNNISNQAREVI